MTMSTSSDFPNRLLQKAMLPFLKAAIPNLASEQFGQTFVQGEHNGRVANFQRINKLSNTPVALIDGSTPAGIRATTTQILASLTQYGNYIEYTDEMTDLGEPAVLNAFAERLGEQAAEVAENIRLSVLKGCANVFYNTSSTALRTNVNQTMKGANGLAMQRKIVRGLLAQDAKYITKVLSGSPKANTSPVEASFVALCHTNAAADIRDLPDFKPVAEYGSMVAYPNELGSCEDVRYITSTLITPYADGGAAISGISGSALSTTGTSADVYPIIYLGKDAFGSVVLRGKFAAQLLVSPPKAAPGDALAQRGTMGWKSYMTTVLLNDLWMAVGEVCVSA